MPRGRQYYDPILQVPGSVEGEQDLSRVEVYQDETLKWWGRQVAPDGTLTGYKVGDFDHATLLKTVRETWPNDPVYELRNADDDSTWEGHGPSPRLWQNSSPGGAVVAPPVDAQSGPPASGDAGAGDEPVPPAVPEQVPLRLVVAPERGTYVRLEDVVTLLHMWATQFEDEKNPSAAFALREAAGELAKADPE